MNEIDTTTDKSMQPANDDQKLVSEQFWCERCGYSLEGLEVQSGVCPECGKLARESLPSARVGTPWQIKPGPIAYLWTVQLVLTQPRTIWDAVRLERVHALGLLLTTLFLVGFGGSVLMLAGLAAPMYIVQFAVLFTLALVILTLVEMLGLCVFGRRRGFRMTGDVPLVICAHAVSGWYVSVAGMVLVTRVTQVVVLGQLRGAGWLEQSLLIYGWSIPRTIVFMLGAFISGMVCYSLLAGAGYHRLRYANRPEIEQDRGGGAG